MSLSKSFDYNIESLRGFAALFVVIGHIINKGQYIDPYYFSNDYSKFTTPGHTSVLIFFVLSGYVIGLTTKGNLKANGILPYLKKRFLRLYPIYFLCILFTLLIAPTHYSLSTILANFTFLQVMFAPVILEIAPVWSLHYEVIFYLLFIPISFFNINPILVIVSCITLGIGNFFLFPDMPLFTSLCFGLSFWSSGLVIARYFPFKESSTTINYNLLLSHIFLILSLESYNVLNTALSKVLLVLFNHTFIFPETMDWAKRAITLLNFSFLPYCIMFVLSFASKQFRFKKVFMLTLQLLPALTLIHIFSNLNETTIDKFIIPTIYYGLSLIFYFLSATTFPAFSKKILAFGIWVGSISYGIYLIHYPLLVIMNRIDFISGSLLTYLLRIFVYLILTFLAAIILEKKYHPWMKNLINRGNQ